MGQNMVGWLRLKVTGSKGTVVTLRHAEVMDKFGEFYTTNLRLAKCQLTYTLAGTGEETYEPRFTFMGFRFVEVTGFPGELTLDNLTGVVVHSDMTVSIIFSGVRRVILLMSLPTVRRETNVLAGQAMPRHSAEQPPIIWMYLPSLQSG